MEHLPQGIKEKDEHRTYNIQRPTSNKKQTSTLDIFQGYPG